MEIIIYYLKIFDFNRVFRLILQTSKMIYVQQLLEAFLLQNLLRIQDLLLKMLFTFFYIRILSICSISWICHKKNTLCIDWIFLSIDNRHASQNKGQLSRVYLEIFLASLKLQSQTELYPIVMKYDIQFIVPRNTTAYIFSTQSLQMKDNQKQDRAPSQALRKLRHPKIIHRHESPFEAKHNSLRKLMEMRILPPLHPQTDVKRTIQPAKHCCPEEFQQATKEVSVLMLGKSEQLLSETPKFSFENIVIKHLQRSPEKMMTISHDQVHKKRKQSQLGITFGKLTKKQESHRYTEMEEREAKDKRRKPLIQLSNFSKLGKYDSIFKPLLKENVRGECEVIKDRVLPLISTRHI